MAVKPPLNIVLGGEVNVEQYLERMKFPPEWAELCMLPEPKFIQNNIDTYELGMEDASEHDRYGFFCYWLRRELTSEQVDSLKQLAIIDPDQIMGVSVLQEIEAYEVS